MSVWSACQGRWNFGLVEEGTWAWLEVSDSDLFKEPLSPEVVASVFANRHVYLVLANYGNVPVEVVTDAKYTSLSVPDGEYRDRWLLKARTLAILMLHY